MGCYMYHIIFLYLKTKNKISNIKELGERPYWKVEDFYLPKTKNLKATVFSYCKGCGTWDSEEMRQMSYDSSVCH